MRPQPTCYNKALELLARRGHFRRELAHKLAKRGYDEEEVETTLVRLEEKNFLDDRALARDYANSRLRRRPMGRALLASELRARGVDDVGIEEALAELTPEREADLARAAAEEVAKEPAWDAGSVGEASGVAGIFAGGDLSVDARGLSGEGDRASLHDY